MLKYSMIEEFNRHFLMDSEQLGREKICLWDYETFICPEGDREKKKARNDLS